MRLAYRWGATIKAALQWLGCGRGPADMGKAAFKVISRIDQ